MAAMAAVAQGDARVLLLLVHAPVRADAQAADQRRQRQALQHERHRDHHEGEEDDEVALGNGVPSPSATGSASAAASDTMPRMPHQLMMKSSASGGAGSRSAQHRAHARAADTGAG